MTNEASGVCETCGQSVTAGMALLPEFASVAETAIYFGVGERAIRTGVADESIPSIRLGRIIRIPLRSMAAQFEYVAPPPSESSRSWCQRRGFSPSS